MQFSIQSKVTVPRKVGFGRALEALIKMKALNL